MRHGQSKDSHDEKQAKGDLRLGIAEKVLPTHKSEWFFDIFLWEYTKFVGLSRISISNKGRASTLLQFNVGSLHFTVERWRAEKGKRYG